VIGNTHLPIEEILESIEDRERNIEAGLSDSDIKPKTKILFLYGTTFS